MISLEGLQSGIAGEDRAIAILKVEHNGQTYDWMTFVPPDTNLATYIAASEARVKDEIDVKEAAWAALDSDAQEALNKSDVVRADNPDYYASRRAEYPSLADQLDAMWKGGYAMTEMAAKIITVKQKYPKP
jgi:hypothetical protein